MDYITINSDTNYWNNLQLVAKYPPTNYFGWVWGAEGRSENDRIADRFFVANSDYPITDPWKRPLQSWINEEQSNSLNDWLLCEDQGDKINEDFYYRYASIENKIVKLYLQMPV